jgi:Fic family protein
MLPHPSKQNHTISLLDEASRALGELAGLGRMLPNPHLLIGSFLRREAILSSQIEGTIASMDQLLLFEAVPERRGTPDVQEVSNYVAAMGYGMERLKELPVCLRLIRELHEKLLGGVRGAEKRPGEFRGLQNSIGIRGQAPADARFVPPPVPEMTQALYSLEDYLNLPWTLPPLIQIALTHYQFEAIHPFEDGNGRVGRLLLALQLCERELLPAPLLYLSAYFERNRAEYGDAMLRVSQNGAWIAWIEFFLRGVLDQSRDAVRRSGRLLDLWQDYRGRLQTARSSALPLALVDRVFSVPVVTIPLAQDFLEVTARSSQLTIEKLEQAGVLTEVTGQQRYRVYVARELVDLLAAPEV